MSQRKAPETYRELLRLLIEFLTELEDETPEEVDEYLRNAGYDPDELVARMRLRIQHAMDESPINWRNQSAQIQKERKRLSDLTPMLSGDIAQIKVEINRLFGLLGTNPKLALHHRKLNLDEMSEADLAQLRGELEYQLSQRRNSSHNADDR